MSGGVPQPRASKYLEGEIVAWQDGWMLSSRDGRRLPLSHLSSGSKETLPILAALDYYEGQRGKSGHLPSAELYGKKLYSFDDFTIEEPEASVFPQTQYDLVREFVGLTNEVNFEPHFTVTTHSPYLLAAFNNLLEAWQVGHADKERGKAVRAVIDEKYWANPDEFRAYSIEGGHLNSIMDEGTHLISDNYLDAISERIGGEFDELLRIGYVEA
jgi:hypothetical protein